MPPRVKQLQGSAWTADEPRAGWRHFHVVGLERRAERWVAVMAASCDAARRLDVPVGELLKQVGWRAGWASRATL